MLVLSRKVRQEVVLTIPAGLGPVEIRVGVGEIDGDKVRLGFDAPAAVKIFRTELLPKPPEKGT